MELIAKQSEEFYNHKLTLEQRIFYLKKLRSVLLDNEAKIKNALHLDLKKPEFEANILEYYILINEIDYFLKKLPKLTKIKPVSVQWHLKGTKAYLYPEPFGKVLIMGAWNFPFQLSLLPLIGAIAAGNIVTLKPSELAKNSESLLVKIIKDVFPENIVEVVTGGAEVAQLLLQRRFDLIFFTGSPDKGKIVMRAAAENLTPVILELGGKNPLIAEDITNLDKMAADICRMKFINCGQHCISIDYILVNRTIKDALLEKIIFKMKEFYGDDPKLSKFYARIINVNNFNRIINYLNNAKIVHGGDYDLKQNYIGPTIVEILNTEIAGLMTDEIFGPILPIITYDKLDDAIDIIKHKEKPLVVYLLSNDKSKCQKVINEVSAGGIDINELGAHFLSWNLPFGGIGYSGMGSYHRKASFDAFTHYKPVSISFLHWLIPLKYPPFFKKKWLFKIFK